MNSDQLEVLKALVETPSPSGFEGEIARYIHDELTKYTPDVSIDFMGNVSCKIEGKSDKVVMIDAHSDQIGFIVNNIDEHGQISLQCIGGSDSSILSARSLIILTESGPINAVVNRKAAHLVVNEQDEMIYNMYDAIVDIGIKNKNKVNKIVKVGDPVIYKPVVEEMFPGFYVGCGLDDKVGCWVLIDAIKRILKSRAKPVPTLIFTFSVQEETWGRKCRPLVKRHNPNLAIEVDVTFATDWDEHDRSLDKQAGRCELGAGPVLYRGVDIDKGTFDLLEEVAKRKEIPVQYQASTGQIGYTVNELSHENQGIRALILGLPLRNMYSPVEVTDSMDLENSAKLLAGFLTSKKLADLI